MLGQTAMILAAGHGTRMRPLTEQTPKPLIRVDGAPLIDYVFRALGPAEVQRAVVNVHYLADQIERYIMDSRAAYPELEIIVSDERAQLLDTGGGVFNALALLGGQPFFIINSDNIWQDGAQPALIRLRDSWRQQDMDALLLLASSDRAIGYHGSGDFARAADGRLQRTRKNALIYMGVALFNPILFDNALSGPFSLNRCFDTAIARGRLFGLVHDGDWMHVGTPQAVHDAEQRLRQAPYKIRALR